MRILKFKLQKTEVNLNINNIQKIMLMSSKTQMIGRN